MSGTSSGHFCAVAPDYARFRPGYPAALFEALEAASPDRRLAWDCATGSGQAALGLARWFERVIATDASAAQLAAAPAHPRVTWRRAPAEASGLPAASVSLIAVAQALHWFELPRFLAEAARVLRPDGTLAVWSYARPRLETPALQSALDDFHDGVLGDCWPIERRAGENAYAEWRVFAGGPRSRRFAIERAATLEAFLGYLGTWSALGRYRERRGEDPLPQLAARLRAHWGPGARTVRWPLTLRLGRPHAQPGRAGGATLGADRAGQ